MELGLAQVLRLDSVWGDFVTWLVPVRQSASLFLFGLGQNGDVFRSRLLGDRHQIDRRAKEDAFVAAQKQGFRIHFDERFVDFFLQVARDRFCATGDRVRCSWSR